MNRGNISKCLLAATLGGFAVTSQAQVTYRVTELAPVAGYSTTTGYALNDKGDAVGMSSPVVTDFNYVGTVWRNGLASSLGKVAKGNYSVAEAINNSGVITGEADNGSIRPEAVTFSGGKATIFDSGANNSRGIYVSDSGVIVGNYAKGFGGGGWNPVVYTPDPKKPGRYSKFFLPHYQDGTTTPSYNYVFNGNNKGQIVGQVSTTTFSARGGFWNNDAAHSLTLLSTLPNEWDSYAYGINDLGTVVGVSDVGTFGSTPVIWTGAEHTIAALPLAPGDTQGSAYAINNAGTIIGYHGDSARPCVWINGQMIDLASALDASSFGWQIESVNDINNLGQIVGTGYFNGKQRGFILTPTLAP